MIDFVGKRRWFFALSIIIILAGLVGYLLNGLNLDIQFQGGTLVKVQMENDTFDVDKIASVVGDALNKKVTGQKLKTYNAASTEKEINMLQINVSSSETLTGDELNKVYEILRTEFGVKEDAQTTVQNVSPFIGKEMLQNSLLAILLAALTIILYVWWRFRVLGLPAAVIAIIALLHDSAVMFAVYTIFRLPLNESFVAAVLTILGYSINDTIVIYDRVRENSGLMRKVNYSELINRSVNQTMSRSINTTLTTLICIISVFVFASVYNIQSLKEFTLPLVVGMISGSYSTIFIAGPLWAVWKEAHSKKRLAAKTSKA